MALLETLEYRAHHLPQKLEWIRTWQSNKEGPYFSRDQKEVTRRDSAGYMWRVLYTGLLSFPSKLIQGTILQCTHHMKTISRAPLQVGVQKKLVYDHQMYWCETSV